MILLLILLVASPCLSMPPVAETEATKDRIYIRMADGKSFAITRTQILDHYAEETGTAAQRKQKTLDWVKSQMIDTLGIDMNVTVDYTSDADRQITLEVSE